MITRKDAVALAIFFAIGMTGTYIISEVFLIEKTPEERGLVSPAGEEKPDPADSTEGKAPADEEGSQKGNT